jgi:DNA-binding SARP family transcriptional activator
MDQLQISLFGKFSARYGEQALSGLDACKVQELFCYLLLHADRPHHRETLASLLWPEQPPAQSKSYLRRTLWQLQSVFNGQDDLNSVVRIESDWIQVNCTAVLRLDVALFEKAFIGAQGKTGAGLDATAVQALAEAVQMYRGDLLEGWYLDWCLFERERYQQMLLMMLDKLMEYCEACCAYESAIGYGMQILRHDLARERTHRRLMRLYYLSGDRTGALRQYERCTAVLQQELGVKPAASTERLHNQIQADHLETLVSVAPTSPHFLQDTLHRLQDFDAILNQTRQQIQQEIHRVQSALSLGD